MRHDQAIRELSIALQHLTTPDWAHSTARDAEANEIEHLRQAYANAHYAAEYCRREMARVPARRAAEAAKAAARMAEMRAKAAKAAEAAQAQVRG